MHLFGCKFSFRTESGDTIPDRKNFDSLLWAIVTVFQVGFLVTSSYCFLVPQFHLPVDTTGVSKGNFSNLKCMWMRKNSSNLGCQYELLI